MSSRTRSSTLGSAGRSSDTTTLAESAEVKRASLNGLPVELRRHIFGYVLKGHVILPFPEEPPRPSNACQRLLLHLFSKIDIANAPPFNGETDLMQRFNNIIRAAIHGTKFADPVEPPQRRSLLGLLLTCKKFNEEAVPILYENSIFDINVIDSSHKAQTSTTPAGRDAYRNQAVLPAGRLDKIRYLHLSTRPLSTTVQKLNNTPTSCLKDINTVLLSCCTTTANHVPCASVRHHIPHGPDWVQLWQLISTKLARAEVIEAEICGWRVPPGWRSEILAPMHDAAKDLGLIVAEKKRKHPDGTTENAESTLATGKDADAKKGKSGKKGDAKNVSKKTKVKLFHVTVPWTQEQVNGHVANTDLGFELEMDQEANEQAKKGRQGADETGWTAS